ncbi:replication initiator protein [Capybara microvirus Cap1_SP_178]|nr:replication initiator protein [Capybara microvirus Cap1_SP_178]
MPCFHPVRAWLCKRKDFSNIMLFRDPLSRISAFHSISEVYLPCGHCFGCRLRHAAEWTLRCQHESSLYKQNCFITLTYDDDHLPKINGIPSLPMYTFDFQPFLKRLRKRVGKFRFYMVSEYGSRTERPHYHAIIFGWSPPDLKPWKLKDGHLVYRSDILEKCWPYGFSTVGACCEKTIRYVARYCMKKLDGKMGSEWLGPRLPDYTRMSLKPGIGQGWIDRFHDDVYKVDFTAERTIQDGVRVSPSCIVKPPRYYDRCIDVPPSPGPLRPMDALSPSQVLGEKCFIVMRDRQEFSQSAPAPNACELARKEEHARYVAECNYKARVLSRMKEYEL